MDITPEIFTADYTGQPGDRTFFLQSRSEAATLSYLLEKQQLAVLAEKMREVLIMVNPEDPVVAATPERDPLMALSAPIEPEWRVGTIGIAYAEDADRIVLSMHPVEEPDEEEIEQPVVPEPEDFAVRFVMTREQTRSFVLHALAAVSEGRAICQLCGLPMDPAGHKCPASNGHRLSEV
jgi:uncharacterized repeat protein (TIGR03847 family)